MKDISILKRFSDFAFIETQNREEIGSFCTIEEGVMLVIQYFDDHLITVENAILLCNLLKTLPITHCAIPKGIPLFDKNIIILESQEWVLHQVAILEMHYTFEIKNKGYASFWVSNKRQHLVCLIHPKGRVGPFVATHHFWERQVKWLYANNVLLVQDFEYLMFTLAEMKIPQNFLGLIACERERSLN